jgi:hypothetical protein
MTEVDGIPKGKQLVSHLIQVDRRHAKDGREERSIAPTTRVRIGGQYVTSTVEGDR